MNIAMIILQAYNNKSEDEFWHSPPIQILPGVWASLHCLHPCSQLQESNFLPGTHHQELASKGKKLHWGLFSGQKSGGSPDQLRALFWTVHL